MNNDFNNQQNYYQAPPQPIYASAPRKSEAASSSQTFGIVALVLQFLAIPIVPIVLGIIAIKKAKTANTELGFEQEEARNGKICGIIALVLGILSLIATVVGVIISFVTFILPFVLPILLETMI